MTSLEKKSLIRTTSRTLHKAKDKSKLNFAKKEQGINLVLFETSKEFNRYSL